MADKEQEGEEKAEGGGSKKLIIFIVIALVLVGISVGVTIFLMMGGDDGDSAEEASTEPVKQPAIYQSLDPPFIIDFDVEGRQRFLQVYLTVMGRDQEAIDGLKTHMPLIRNKLVLLIGGFEYQLLRSEKGKEELREALTKSIQKILRREVGKEGVERVLFTNFVMQ